MKMKSKIFIVLTLVLLLIPGIVGASEGGFQIFVNDEQVAIPNNLGAPFIDMEDRTQIPLRAVSEILGNEVKWDSVTQTITIVNSNNQEITLAIGSDKVITPEKTITMDTKAVLIKERTYVPLRFVSEALNYNVYYQWLGHHNISIRNIATDDTFHRPDNKDLPEEILNWIELSRELPMEGLPLVLEMEYDGQRFVLVAEGVKPTGGYSIEVVGSKIIENEIEKELVIEVKSTKPNKDDDVTQALTYPSDLIIVENKELPLRVVDVDDKDRYFMSLAGIEQIQPIVASSDYIKVFEPKPSQEVSNIFKISGVASVFEGTINYELKTKSGDIVLEGFTTAGMANWNYFEEEIEIPENITETDLFLELYSESAKDGSKMFAVTIPLGIK